MENEKKHGKYFPQAMEMHMADHIALTSMKIPQQQLQAEPYEHYWHTMYFTRYYKEQCS